MNVDEFWEFSPDHSITIAIFPFVEICNKPSAWTGFYAFKSFNFPSAGADDILFTDPNQSQLTSEPVDYIPYNNIPMGATHYKDRIFVTVPRFVWKSPTFTMHSLASNKKFQNVWLFIEWNV